MLAHIGSMRISFHAVYLTVFMLAWKTYKAEVDYLLFSSQLLTQCLTDEDAYQHIAGVLDCQSLFGGVIPYRLQRRRGSRRHLRLHRLLLLLACS